MLDKHAAQRDELAGLMKLRLSLGSFQVFTPSNTLTHAPPFARGVPLARCPAVDLSFFLGTNHSVKNGGDTPPHKGIPGRAWCKLLIYSISLCFFFSRVCPKTRRTKEPLSDDPRHHGNKAKTPAWVRVSGPPVSPEWECESRFTHNAFVLTGPQLLLLKGKLVSLFPPEYEKIDKEENKKKKTRRREQETVLGNTILFSQTCSMERSPLKTRWFTNLKYT